ncbi:hypothetical protein [Niabella sp.]|uniref:hypothetical protein n=1 Tax=Niabella sp. TaxID=1962976 RepID=UPI002617A6A3|nr:hypothetical protein [Niabella sp.]
MLIERGAINEESEIINFLKDGYDQFELAIAKRIMNETPEKVFLNSCSRCNKLARTPYARQCRHCGYSWHELTIAQFKINDAFQIGEEQFFLQGQIVKGAIRQGQFMDLTFFGLNIKPKIEVIECADKSVGGKIEKGIRLGTTELSEEEKKLIKSKSSFGIQFDIVKEP